MLQVDPNLLPPKQKKEFRWIDDLKTPKYPPEGPEAGKKFQMMNNFSVHT